MAELVDALASGASGGNPVEVQVLSSVPTALQYKPKGVIHTVCTLVIATRFASGILSPNAGSTPRIRIHHKYRDLRLRLTEHTGLLECFFIRQNDGSPTAFWSRPNRLELA